MRQGFKWFRSARGSAQVISTVVPGVILVCAYVALDFYTGGRQNASMVEGRGDARPDAYDSKSRSAPTA